jgi:hypothetical protein
MGEIIREGSIERLNVAKKPLLDGVYIGRSSRRPSGRDGAAETPKLPDQVVVLLPVSLMTGIGAANHQGLFEQEVHVRVVVELVDELEGLF